MLTQMGIVKSVSVDIVTRVTLSELIFIVSVQI